MVEKSVKLAILLKTLNQFLEILVKEEYPSFETVMLNNINQINKLNGLMVKCKERIKQNVPAWVLGG